MTVNQDINTLKAINREFKAEFKDNAILTYGYIDGSAGVSFEVLCMAYVPEDGIVELGEGDNLHFTEGSIFKISSTFLK